MILFGLLNLLTLVFAHRVDSQTAILGIAGELQRYNSCYEFSGLRRCVLRPCSARIALPLQTLMPFLLDFTMKIFSTYKLFVRNIPYLKIGYIDEIYRSRTVH